MNLTEFGRAVHAEMEAILAAARVGIPVKGSTLYTTTEVFEAILLRGSGWHPTSEKRRRWQGPNKTRRFATCCEAPHSH